MDLPAIPEKKPASVCRIPLGRFKRDEAYLRRQIASFRRVIEEAVIRDTGHVTELAAKKIGTACKAMIQTMRVEKILATKGMPGTKEGLTHEQWLAYSDRILKYSETADKALATLGLKAVPEKGWAGWLNFEEDEDNE